MIGLRTMLAYLCGGGGAVRRVAAHPRALGVGLVLVLAAGFAREYDGEDLLHAPWHLALPLVASLVTSFVLYVIVRPVLGPRPQGRQEDAFFEGYPALLRAYWWTAPLAFLYAIPVERMMGPADATRWNLRLLGLVAAWRVLLITRAVSVLWRRRYLAAFFPVMLFADGVALALLAIAPLPVFSIMGGVRLTESERVLRDTADLVTSLGVLTGVVWFVGTLVVLARRPRPAVPPADREADERGSRVSRPLAVACALALLGWVPVLLRTQPEQQRRRAVEAALRASRFDDLVAHVRGRERGDFPPHWDPPPRPGYGESEPDPRAVLEALRAAQGVPAWFVALYVEKADATSEKRHP